MILTRAEAIDVLSVIDEAIDQLLPARIFTLVLSLQHAARLLTDRLFPDLPPPP